MTPPSQWLYYIGQFIGQYNPVDLIALLVMIVALVWLWRISLNKADTYDFSDNFKDPFTNKAAAANLVYMFMAGLCVWWVVRFTVGGGDPSNTLLAILGIFIAKAGADRAISAWGTRQPDKAPPTEPRVEPQVTDVQPEAVAPVSVQVVAPAEIVTKTTVKGKTK